MKIAVISDIHSNLEALTRVLESIEGHDAEAIYCLGDIVGYGPQPAECLELVREKCVGSVRGNHDEAVAIERGLDYLPGNGRDAAIHNRKELSAEQIGYLTKLPLTLEVDNCTFVHSTPHLPEAWIRIESYRIAQEQFKHFSTDFCFVGHTHIPAVMASKLGVLNVRPGHRYLINTGSVGQPRDHSPRACYALFDTERVACEFIRVSYDVEATIRKIIDAGLPPRLGERLKKGQ